jgi:arylsulfatase A-like enzyme
MEWSARAAVLMTPENDTWPDAANTPFRSQKDTNWEGAWRVPCFLRWPRKIKPGTVFNGIVNHQDMLPTLLAAAGETNIKDKLLHGYKVGDKTFRVHIDGFNQLPYLTGEVKESPRNFFFYVSDDGGILALRVEDYKLVFQLQEAVSTNVWSEPFTKVRLPRIFHLGAIPSNGRTSTRMSSGIGDRSRAVPLHGPSRRAGPA